MHSIKSRKVYEKLRTAFDNEVNGLTQEEYKEVMEDLIGHVDSCLDCLKDEAPSLFA